MSGPDVTVDDDDPVDVLQGAAGTDWFFANLSGGVLDVLDGPGGSEIVEALSVPAP